MPTLANELSPEDAAAPDASSPVSAGGPNSGLNLGGSISNSVINIGGGSAASDLPLGHQPEGRSQWTDAAGRAAIITAVIAATAGIAIAVISSGDRGRAGSQNLDETPGAITRSMSDTSASTDDRARPSSPSVSTTDAASLPTSWVGIWTGTGPGNPSADGITQLRTSSFTVTVTLRAAALGDLAGTTVSMAPEVGTGRDLGCTQALRLREIRRTYVVFEGSTGHPTDPSFVGSCPPGNTYVVTMTDPDTLVIGDESANYPGAPSTLTRQS